MPCRNRYPTPGRSGRRDASTDSHAGTSGWGTPLRGLGLGDRWRRPWRVGDHFERAVERRAQRLERDDAVDDTVPVQVLRGLNAGREGFTVEVLVDPRAEESDECTRFGGGDVTERTP